MADDRCGTYAGWNAHKARGETPCEDCAQAHAHYTRHWRWKTGRTTKMWSCPQCGSRFYDHRCVLASAGEGR